MASNPRQKEKIDMHKTRYKPKPTQKNEERHQKQMELLFAWRAGDKVAGNRLIKSLEGYVVKQTLAIARFYDLEVDDLIGESYEGLVKGLRKFKPESNVRILTYCSHWIFAYASRRAKQMAKHHRAEFSGYEFDAAEESYDSYIESQFADQTEPHSSEDAHLVRGFLGLVKKNGADALDCAVIDQRLLTETPLDLQHIAAQFSVSREAVRQRQKKLLKKLERFILDTNKNDPKLCARFTTFVLAS